MYTQNGDSWRSLHLTAFYAANSERAFVYLEVPQARTSHCYRMTTKRGRRLQGPLRRRRGIRWQAQRSADDNQGEAVGGAKDGFLADSEADQTHPRTTCQRNGIVHEGHTGKIESWSSLVDEM